MISHVLLDLDNTLISNPDREFALAFVNIFNEQFYNSLNIKNAADHLRKAIQDIGRHQNLLMTNSERILSILSHESQVESEKIHKVLSLFYDEIYPELQPYVSMNPVSRLVIEELLEQEITIVIATQPIYPKVAVTKRLEWGNLSNYITNFELITHSQNMHSAKPSATYYSEIINTLDLQVKSVLMVGDSIKNDIKPSSDLGLKTFHVSRHSSLKHFLQLIRKSGWKSNFRSSLS